MIPKINSCVDIDDFSGIFPLQYEDEAEAVLKHYIPSRH